MWLLGARLPAEVAEAAEVEEISSGEPVTVVEIRPEPPRAVPVIATSPESAMDELEALERESLVTGKPQRARRLRRTVAPPVQKVTAKVDLVRIEGIDASQVPRVRAAVLGGLGSLRVCVLAAMSGRPHVRGTVSAKVTARHGRIEAIDIVSEIRDVPLRWCFRKMLTALQIDGSAFDGRLEFFVLPRTGPGGGALRASKSRHASDGHRR